MCRKRAMCPCRAWTAPGLKRRPQPRLLSLRVAQLPQPRSQPIASPRPTGPLPHGQLRMA